MAEDFPNSPPRDNIIHLISQLGQAFEGRLLQFRRGTRYEHVWHSDARVFGQATRRKMTISEIARTLKITRQAVQASVKRLRALDVVDVESIPGNRRDKFVVLTARGLLAQASAVKQVAAIEDDIAKALHPMDLETFRNALMGTLEAMNRLVNSSDAPVPLSVRPLE